MQVPRSAARGGEDDHLVHPAVELVEAAHVSGRYEVGIDHAGPFFERARLGDDAGTDQSTADHLAPHGRRAPGQAKMLHIFGQNM